MDWIPAAFRWLFASGFDSEHGAFGRLIPRWLFLRALGCIYFSAFFSLVFQIRGLIGPEGILPADEYLRAVAHSVGYSRGLWYAPTLLWLASRPHMLTALCWVGMGASLLLVLNAWPRGMLTICFLCFLSFVSAAQDFSGYQSDGMLLEAGFIALFFSPPGFRPGLGAASPPSRASLFLLLWEWFRIYFESGVAKIIGGDPEWRNFTAMDEYYQNGPLPTWIGWYMQHLPHWFHASTVFATLTLELVLVWMFVLPRRWRIACFFIVTPWQLVVILTANYTFLNYLVLMLGFLLLDDRFLLQFLPQHFRERWKRFFVAGATTATEDKPTASEPSPTDQALETSAESGQREQSQPRDWKGAFRQPFRILKLSLSGVMLSWIFYATTAELIWMFSALPLPTTPVELIEPFRIANRYGLFGIMTRGRYEIEFQGSEDGKTWVVYPFRYKPQDLSTPPGIYAPYQPRFDWNLWFASLGSWRDYPIVLNTEVRLLSNDNDVLTLFEKNPFPHEPPRQVRAVVWQYWFTTMSEKRRQGLWWRRQFVGLYAPTIEREPDGTIRGVEWSTVGPHE
ncbi:MAG TPA: lipase maturation factor family protein [Terriglobales bacterium]|jgi:lipase maturation factor 1|nr:lipase maturation factor family protein [Terriglobales bacterium]